MFLIFGSDGVDWLINLLRLSIISITEGVTELLPVSSTAHILLLLHVFNINSLGISLSLLQFVAFFSVMLYYFVFIYELIFPWSYRKFFRLLLNVFFTLLPLLIGYFLIKQHLSLSFDLTFIAYSLIFGGFIIYFVEKFCNQVVINNIDDISYKHAFIIGLFQMFCVFPGISRLGSVIVASRILGFSRSLSVDVGFLVGIPIVPGFFLYELINEDGLLPSDSINLMIFSYCLAFFSSMFCIRYVIKFLKSEKIIFLAYYRIFIGILILMYLHLQ